MEANQMAHQMSSFLNTMSCKNKEFCRFMAQDHKTLQQRFTALCFEWVRHCSTEGYGQSTDGRNEDSHRICKMIVKQFGDEMYVPFV